MSADELREYCLSLRSFGLRVQIRFKNGQDTIEGRITEIQKDGFHLVGDDDVVQQLRYTWIARIKGA